MNDYRLNIDPILMRRFEIRCRERNLNPEETLSIHIEAMLRSFLSKTHHTNPDSSN